jgi:hypothetical protein
MSRLLLPLRTFSISSPNVEKWQPQQLNTKTGAYRIVDTFAVTNSVIFLLILYTLAVPSFESVVASETTVVADKKTASETQISQVEVVFPSSFTKYSSLPLSIPPPLEGKSKASKQVAVVAAERSLSLSLSLLPRRQERNKARDSCV